MKRILVVSCSHGAHMDKESANAVLKFKRDYKPHKTIHLGDFLDLSAFMGSHLDKGKGDEIEPDLNQGIDFVNELEPDLLFMGNHEDRIWNLEQHGSELIRWAAKQVRVKIEKLAKSLHAELIPYTGTFDPNSCRLIGGTAFLHGYMFSEQACRDHAEMIGRPIVMGHVHKLIRQPGRCHGAPEGISVGCLASIPAMHYAKNRRATASWDNGFAFGNYDTNWCKLHLERIKAWQPAKIPVRN